MNSISSLFQKHNMGQLTLSTLFLIYLVLGYQTPLPIANLVDTVGGRIVVIVLAIILFCYTNPILGVLGLLVAFNLLRSSAIVTGTGPMAHYLPNEARKFAGTNARNEFPYTLEQEVVKKMAPPMGSANAPHQVTFSPIVDNIHNAAPLHN